MYFCGSTEKQHNGHTGKRTMHVFYMCVFWDVWAKASYIDDTKAITPCTHIMRCDSFQRSM